MEKNIENNNSKKEILISKIKSGLKSFWDLIKYAVFALLIVLPIRAFIAQPFLVSGESMYPTFHDGEYLIVDELSYKIHEPKRGDVIIFRYPGDTKRFFIKRIIGLPNEKISIADNKVTIFNDENPLGFTLTEPYINEQFDTKTIYKTEKDEYFVMGDNRNKSSDSRVWGEPLTTKLTDQLIIGRAYLRLFPLDRVTYLPGYYNEEK